MKTLFLIPVILFSYFIDSFAQRYKNPDLTIMEWMSDDCVVTDRNKLAEAIENLPSGKVCTALVGEMFYLFFNDDDGNRHQLCTPKNNPEEISFAMFEGQTTNLLVMGEFYWGSLVLNQHAYTPLVDEYEGKQYLFRDWKHYFNNFSKL